MNVLKSLSISVNDLLILNIRLCKKCLQATDVYSKKLKMSVFTPLICCITTIDLIASYWTTNLEYSYSEVYSWNKN